MVLCELFATTIWTKKKQHDSLFLCNLWLYFWTAAACWLAVCFPMNQSLVRSRVLCAALLAMPLILGTLICSLQLSLFVLIELEHNFISFHYMRFYYFCFLISGLLRSIFPQNTPIQMQFCSSRCIHVWCFWFVCLVMVGLDDQNVPRSALGNDWGMLPTMPP